MPSPPQITGLSALTLATQDIDRAIAFYTALGFALVKHNREAHFATFRAGMQYLNITAERPDCKPHWWGRGIFYVDNVDAMYAHAVKAGITPEFPPRDAPWGERYFHLMDPDGHELSFAHPLPIASRTHP